MGGQVGFLAVQNYILLKLYHRVAHKVCKIGMAPSCLNVANSGSMFLITAFFYTSTAFNIVAGNIA